LTVSQIRTLLPSLWSFSAGYARELPFISKWREWYVPLIFAEAGLFYSSMNPYSLLGGSVMAGPLWFYRIAGGHQLIAQLGGGLNYSRVRDNRIDEVHIAPHAGARLGYGFAFSSWIAIASMQFHYIHDNLTPLSAAGITLSAGKVFGDMN
jgi:hypothetical protein